MKKSRGIISLVVTVALIILLGFTTIVGFGDEHTGSMRNIRLGLDLDGGLSITYQVKGERKPSAEDMNDTIYKLQKRVEQYSTEATVYQEGSNRISIEIPGVSNATQVLEELGKPGSLYFIAHHDADGNENYTVGSRAEDSVLNQTIEELKENGGIVLTGTEIKSAKPLQTTNQQTGNNQYVVELNLTDKGAEKFAAATKEAVENGNDSIGIYYDEKFVSIPSVESEITDGVATITGMDSYEEAENLASTIRIGGLKLELEELDSQVVGAQLGEEAIETSLQAGMIGLVIVFVFMCVVYLLPGLASSLALLIYTGLVLVLLNAFDLTLTLPGIAGIILSIGMAVDANVIIFARVKEELAEGRSAKTALKTGFQKAMSAIVDGNITTLIAAIVLGVMGTGPVKGFAQTLGLGIVVSMFTAIVITRMIIFAFYALGIHDKKFYARVKKEREPIPFLKNRKVFFLVSACVIAAGLAGMGIYSAKGDGALEYSLEFEGGTSTNVTFPEDYSLKELDKQVVPLVEEVADDANVQIQKVKDTTQVIMKTKTLSLEQREALNEMLSQEFGVDESQTTYRNISGTISSEMRQDAAVAVIVATICMLLYIWIRFKDVRFANSAVIALVHDVLVVLAFYVLARVSVGNTFIACMLTIVGYSVNATIVIFDRIREELKLRKRNDSLEYIVNKSITQTLTRSIYTSLTTFVMVFVLYIMGVSSIKEFALPLMVGIVCGAYSSVCITGALWYIMRTKIGKHKETALPATEKEKHKKKK